MVVAGIGTLAGVEAVVLSIGKLRVGQEAYHLSGVAQSLDDYYSGAGEAAGWWIGGSAPRLGLVSGSAIDGEDLRAVLAGMAPGGGGLTPNGTVLRAHPRRVPGFDLTFKAPKSVSVLYAVSGDPRVQGAIVDASEAALREAVGWLERDVITVRRGSHNERWQADLARDATRDPGGGPRRLPTSGIVGAVFRHRTSRAADPLLHWHVLVANMAEGTDGRWTALVHPDIFHAARTAGEVFQAVLRHELTDRLGVSWRPGNHVYELVGVPDPLCRAFSKRREEIEAYLDATGGGSSPAAAQAATLATRRNKPEMEGARLDEAWKREATGLGWGPVDAELLIAQAAHDIPTGTNRPGVDDRAAPWRLTRAAIGEDGSVEEIDTIVDADTWIADVLRRDLTANDSTFDRFDVVRAVAARMAAGAGRATIDAIVDRVLASGQVIAVAAPDGDRWTSGELVEVEQRFLRTRTDARAVAIDRRYSDTAIGERPTIGDDQAAAVRALCATTHAVSVLIGPAGTGKTYTMGTVAAAYQTAGYQVIGAAPSARAALELEHAGIDASTMAVLWGRWHQHHAGPDARTVLVIDEAGMAGIRPLEQLVTRTVNAGGRVILVGDHRQLPEISAGGGFAAAAHQPVGVATLTVNRRQTHEWEQQALWALRDGDVTGALTAYRDHDRVDIVDDRATMIARAVDRWFQLTEQGHQPVLLAGTVALVDHLNRTVRERLIAHGALPTAADGHAYSVGDRIVIRRNQYRSSALDGTPIDLINGTTGTVTATSDRSVIVKLDNGDHLVELDTTATAGRAVLDHVYARTPHRAQGGTWTHSIAVGLDGLYQQAAYVQLSRGRDANWFVITAEEQHQVTDLAPHSTALAHPDDEPDPAEDQLDRRLRRSGAKQLATTIDPDAARVHHYATSCTPDEIVTRARMARRLEHDLVAITGVDLNSAERNNRLARHNAHYLTIGIPVRPTDRHNYGTVTAIDDRAGTVTVCFVTADRRHETSRTLLWHEIELIGEPPERHLPPDARARLDQLDHLTDRTRTRWDTELAPHGFTAGDARRYRRALDRTALDHTLRLLHDPPVWLTTLAGPQPDQPIPYHHWYDTIIELTRWQLTHHINPTDGLGPPPDRTASGDSGDRGRWDRLNERVLHSRLQPAREHQPIGTWTNPRTVDELETRHHELEQLFTTAPPDTRDLIATLTRDHALWDTSSELAAAIDTHQARHDWIRTNWPYLIEHHEISRRIDAGPHPIHPDRARPELAHHATGHLADAIAEQQPWLDRALRHLTTCPEPLLTDANLDLLHDIADYRHDTGLDDEHPVGPAPDHTDAYQRWHDLTNRTPHPDTGIGIGEMEMDVDDEVERDLGLEL